MEQRGFFLVVSVTARAAYKRRLAPCHCRTTYFYVGVDWIG